MYKWIFSTHLTPLYSFRESFTDTIRELITFDNDKSNSIVDILSINEQIKEIFPLERPVCLTQNRVKTVYHLFVLTYNLLTFLLRTGDPCSLSCQGFNRNSVV